MSYTYPKLVFPHELPQQTQPVSTDLIFMERRNTDGSFTTYGTGLSSLSASGLTGYSGYSGYSGIPTITTTVSQSAHNFSLGNIIRVSGANTYTLAQANNATNAEAVGIVTSIIDGNSFIYTQYGPATSGVPSDVEGTALFLSDTIPGLLTPVEPTTTGTVSKPMAIITQSGVQMEVLNMRGLIIGSTTTFGQVTVNNANSPYYISGNDYYIDMDAGVSPITAILPDATSIGGKTYNIKKVDTTLNTITILTTNTQTIDGYNSAIINGPWNSISVHSNNVNWLIT
jgi:hypothetical protein